jgi:signal transduction histidine kinase
MIAAKETVNELERLKALEGYAILDTLSEVDYDNLTALAAQICNTKISLISLIDEKRQWFKSKHGLAVSETPREYAFCAHAINQPKEIFIVEDARKDYRFHDNPLVIGDPNIVFYAGVPLENEEGYALGTLCVLDDKPNELKQEQLDALKVLSNHTLTLLELRKTKKELEQSLIKLEEKNAKLESFAMIAAHDIKSPIRNITSLANILLEDHSPNLDKAGVTLIESIKTASIKLNGLVDALLQYAKSDKSIADKPSAIHVRDFCEELKAMLVGYENLNLDFVIQAELIHTNLTALTQILLNLISNAVKYNFKPTVEIKVNISLQADEIFISVKDNGEGIAFEFQERIFDMFKILTNKDRFGKKGNGIGLATVKEKVELLGGKIWLESTPKIGTTFYFTLKNQVSV